MSKIVTCGCGTSHDLRTSPSCPNCGANDHHPPQNTPRHVAYVERRMANGDYARVVGRDLWFELNRVLNYAQHEADDDVAKHYARCLVYLTRTYNSDTENDKYQGREVRR